MAYPNKTINEGSFGDYQAANAIGLYQRVKFTTATGSDQKAKIDVAGATDRGCGIAMQPIAAGAFGTIKFLNSPGEQFGIASGTITQGSDVYTAASGAYSNTQGSGVLAGKAVCTGADAGTFIFVPIIAAA
ncbi:MAG: DUF2190 family protein [Proteobacteria bacterium]|nr:DUF2190 family protein [Pseudomonadota bacterium]